MNSVFDWSEIPQDRGKKLCSACGPHKMADGSENSKGGGWHGEFERVFLPKDTFVTNAEGNLERRVSGDTDYMVYKCSESKDA